MIDILEDLRGGLAVPCQAADDSPLHQTRHIVTFALAALMGSAKAVRINSFADAAAEREAVPVVGITKIVQLSSDVYITPSLNDVRQLCKAGATTGFDARKRRRPFRVPKVFAEVRPAGRIAMAHTSTLGEAAKAMNAGADFGGTPLSGHTSSSQAETLDFVLMRGRSSVLIPFVCEDRSGSLRRLV